MTSSARDGQIDQALSKAAPENPPVPDFNAWLQENQEAVKTLQDQAQQVQAGQTQVRIRTGSPSLRLTRAAALILIVLGLGFGAGRISAMWDADIQQLRADLESSLHASIVATLKTETLEPLNEQLQTALAASADQMRTEILGLLQQDLDDIATQTLTASEAATEQRVAELIQHIEATRLRDYQRMSTALQQLELKRRWDRTQLGNGLLTLAARTAEQTDVSAN